jgi:hypothetical protein
MIWLGQQQKSSQVILSDFEATTPEKIIQELRESLAKDV